jgi:alpha-tubulin suppressor-like RCC1 family protein
VLLPGIRSAILPSRRAIVRSITLMTAALLVGSCGGDGPTGPGDPPEVASVVVTPGADTIVTVGRTRQYSAQPREADGTPISGLAVTWSSSNTAAATVDPNTGLVTAVGGGTATITATVNSIVGTGTFAVVQFVAGVTITPGVAAAAVIGETEAFTAVAKDSSGATVPGVKFLWVSGDPDVATVDTLGVATATGPGEVTISATGRGTPGYAEFTVSQEATQLAFTIQPTDAVAGAAISPAIQVEIRDAGGTLVTDSRLAVSLTILTGPVDGTLFGTKTVNAVGGIATFSGLWLDRSGDLSAPGVYRLQAAAGALEITFSEEFNITAGPATRIDVLHESGAFEAQVPSAAPIYVYFYDAFGNTAGEEPTSLTLLTGAALDSWTTLSHPEPTLVDAGILGFEGVVIDRPGTNFRIEARSGALSATTPPITVRATFTTIATGNDQSCGIAPGGTFCWGSNKDGALGRSLPQHLLARDSVPGRVVDAPPFTQISAGDTHTCGLTAGGAAHCWGRGYYLPTYVTGTGTGSMILTSLTAGAGHACGRTATGAVYCWGEGTQGQLGDGTGASSTTPVLVSGSGSGARIFMSISAGFSFTCGVTTLSTAYCWGDGEAGTLGDSSTVDQTAPVQVAGSGTAERAFVAIDAGLRHTCAINTSGALLCWGLNLSGQLGNASFDPYVPVPIAINFNLPPGPPLLVTSVSAGAHTCAVANGALRCWGENTFGQLGIGLVPSVATPTNVILPGLPTSISVARDHTCANVPAAGVYCWGKNFDGQLGIGTLIVTNSFYPVRVIQ